MKPADLPGWPRGLSVALAAAYVGLSPSTIRTLPGFPPPVALIPGRVVWMREALDRWLDVKAGVVPEVDGWLK